VSSSLPRYLQMKAHEGVLARLRRGHTVGTYARSSPSILFQGEKHDKFFQPATPYCSSHRKPPLCQCVPSNYHVENDGIMPRSLRHTSRLRISTEVELAPPPPSRVSFHPSSRSDTRVALRLTNPGELPKGGKMPLSLASSTAWNL